MSSHRASGSRDRFRYSPSPDHRQGSNHVRRRRSRSPKASQSRRSERRRGDDDDGEQRRQARRSDASSSGTCGAPGTSERRRELRRDPVAHVDDAAHEERGTRGEKDAGAAASLPGDIEDDEYELRTEDDEARMLDERRKQRQAILSRHLAQSPRPTPEHNDSSREATLPPEDSLNDGTFELGKAEDHIQLDSNESGKTRNEEISAAEYDPHLDRVLDREREQKLLGKGHVGGSRPGSPQHGEDGEYEEVEVTDDDDVDDIFAISDEVPKRKKTIRVRKGEAAKMNDVHSEAQQMELAAPAALHDNSDDADGYYRVNLGEKLGENGRYHVFALIGRGMFSSVVKARDTAYNDREVAIKIVRSQETMYKAGLKEIHALKRLESMDAEDKRHLIRLVAHFEHRKHLCMVFESLAMNLREVVKRFGKNVGLNLQAVRAYAHQMFLALALMRKAEVMHADLKPDNILVNEGKTAIKVCDLGSASNLTEMEITPYLVSRFYRAPEIILGMPYDCAIDMWSIGCTLYELFTGKILFPGKSNNHMLQLMQELKGKLTTKQIRKGRFAGMHFDDMNAFVVRGASGNIAGAEELRKVQNFNPVEARTDLRSRLLPPQASKALSASELRLTNNFIDLLSRALELDPARRLTPTQAIQHAFFHSR